jgi:HD-GYP domain-containing protein (c-di-GMP phosphodiesterase class II)
LKKPGPLSDEEWKLMRRHPDIGVEMIRDVKYLSPAIPVIRHHHERWDGSGYPMGLVGDEIPLSARIVAVADSLDAMSSRRPYQIALELNQAYAEIVRGKGVQYDPKVVDAFIQGWETIKQSTG